jgi:molybdopterin-guanine dinucleotide biosynthesis protein B
MSQIVCVVGASDSGKTKLVTSIVAELSRRGWNVATAKHSKSTFSLEPKAKDTFKHRKSGAKTVLFLGPRETVAVRPPGEELGACVARFCSDADIVIAEGFVGENYPKIAIATNRKSESDLTALPNLRALVRPRPQTSPKASEAVKRLPQFRLNDTKCICDFIEKQLLSRKIGTDAYLLVNDKQVPLNAFVRNFLARSVLGIVSSLKGTGRLRSLEVVIRKRN